MEYLLKTSVVIAIFYLCYIIFLQRHTFFNQNRWFLILGLATAFLIPYFVIPIYIEYTPITVTSYNLNEIPVTVQKNIEQPFNILDYLPLVYSIGVFCFFIKFSIQLASLIRLISKNKKSKQGRYIYVETQHHMSPFSFFNWIVYNPNSYNNNELSQIISHEKAHANQYHSIDVLLIQLSCIVLWFNPFIWLYNKSLKQNLEFIADQKAQSILNCKKSYQETLLKTSLSSHQMALSNHFYNSLIKKRIVMLHKSKSKKINQLKYLLILPLLALFLMSFNTEDVYIEKENEVLNILDQDIEDKFILTFNKNTTDIELKKAGEIFKEKFDLKFSYDSIKRNLKNDIIKITVTLQSKYGNTTSTYNNKSGINPFVVEYNPVDFILTSYPIEQKDNETISRKQTNLAKTNNIDEFIFRADFSNKEIKNFTERLKNKGYLFKLLAIQRRDKNNIITSIEFKINKNEVEGNYRVNSYVPLKNISIQYLKKEKAFNINTVNFNNSLKRLTSKKDIIEILIDKNTTNKSLEKQKKLLKEKYDLDFTYDVIERNQKNEIITFSYGLLNISSSTGSKKPIEPIFIKYDPENNYAITYGTNKKGIPEYGNVHFSSIEQRFHFNKNYTQKSLDNLSKSLKKKHDIDMEFSNIKYNEEKEIIAITINAHSKTSSINHSFNSKTPIDDLVISFHGKGYNLKISKYYGDAYTKSQHNKTKNNIDTDTKKDIKHPNANKKEDIKTSLTNKENPKFIKFDKDKIINTVLLPPITKYSQFNNNNVYENKARNAFAYSTYSTGTLLTKEYNPKIIINNIEVTIEDLKKLDPEKIESLNVLKGEHATKKYGNKAKDGVIEVITKKENSNTTTNTSFDEIKVIGHVNNKNQTKENTGVEKENTKRIKFDKDKFISKYSDTDNVLYGAPTTDTTLTITRNSNFKTIVIVDGIEITMEGLKKLDPKKIESYYVLKGEHAIKKYGDKAKDGVIEVTLKK